MADIIDLTACIAKGQVLKVDKEEYEVKFTFQAIRKLEEIYGTVDSALDSLISRKNLYDDVLNFLYAALSAKYKLTKTDIEQWITLSSINILYNIIFEMIIESFGLGDSDTTQGEA